MVTAGQPLAASSRRNCCRHRPSTGRATEHRRVRYLERGDRQRANAPHRARDGTGRNRRHRAERRTETAGDRRCPEERRRRESRVTVGTSVDPPPRCSRLRTCRASGCSRRCPRRTFRAFASGRSRTSTFLRQGASRLRRGRLRLSDAHRPHAHAARPLLGGQSGRASDRASMERRPLNRRAGRDHRAARRSRGHRSPAARVRRHRRSIRAACGDARRAVGGSRGSPQRSQGRRTDRGGRRVPARLRAGCARPAAPAATARRTAARHAVGACQDPARGPDKTAAPAADPHAGHRPASANASAEE